MKKTLSGVLALCLLCGALVGCGGSGVDQEADTTDGADSSNTAESTKISAEQLKSALSNVECEFASISAFTEMEHEGNKHFLSTVSYLFTDGSTETEIGTIDVVSSNDQLEGMMITTYIDASLVQDYMKAALKCINLNDDAIEIIIEESMADTFTDGNGKMYDAGGYRFILGKNDTEFMFYFSDAKDLKDYSEGTLTVLKI